MFSFLAVTPSLLVLASYTGSSHGQGLSDSFDFLHRDLAAANSSSCSLDQTKPPGNLSLCGNSTLFSVWRPKARFIAPEGWMNDPQGLFQRNDGSIHAGYQCHPQHYTWGNISQCAATSKDFVYWEDMNSWENPKTLWPSEVFDIRGVFDGSILKKGYDGYPTTIYTSTFPGALGATSDPAEMEGAETQSLAYTTDQGKSWIKLPLGAHANPIIYQWPMENLTGFRDPYIFASPTLAAVLGNTTTAKGDNFLTISSGIRTGAGPSAGPRLLLYRQANNSDALDWTYLGPLVSLPGMSSFSQWSGNFGINFETASVVRLNEHGESLAVNDPNAINFIGFGTEEGRNGSHENHWPLWASATYSASNGSVTANLTSVGVVDWGRVYASVAFPVAGNRSVLVGWTYEDDESLVLAAQRSYQGAFTLFRDLFVKVIRNVDPSFSDINSPGSWTVKKENDGTTSVVTLGQKIVPEITTAYKSKSKVTKLSSKTIAGNATSSYTRFSTQPTGRHYVVSGSLQWTASNISASDMPMAGFRVLASDQEWTDIYFNPANESLIIERGNSSLVPTYGNDTEVGKLRLWPILNSKTNSPVPQALNFTIVVDNSVVEVYANDVTVITTRVYPWLSASKGAGFLVMPSSSGSSSGSVSFSGVELWDGLLNAWPGRPSSTVKPLVWDGMLPGVWGLWNGF